ncbi:hypothetical protein [Staphylococcus sp. Marseille-Q5304]|uniref:hypothetical protein n=1 Tax=Staphylococcus sp. Marseille-Q5304 TaxID=2942200 RepID=UPI0020736B74|nr:hypothetical protein [Staphylococcus sp. Marseille-Q5304]
MIRKIGFFTLTICLMLAMMTTTTEAAGSSGGSSGSSGGASSSAASSGSSASGASSSSAARTSVSASMNSARSLSSKQASSRSKMSKTNSLARPHTMSNFSVASMQDQRKASMYYNNYLFYWLIMSNQGLSSQKQKQILKKNMGPKDKLYTITIEDKHHKDHVIVVNKKDYQAIQKGAHVKYKKGKVQVES